MIIKMDAMRSELSSCVYMVSPLVHGTEDTGELVLPSRQLSYELLSEITNENSE